MLAESGGIDPHAVAGTICFQNSDGHPAASLSLLAFSGRLELPTSRFGRECSSS
jgi:hypothetical protein